LARSNGYNFAIPNVISNSASRFHRLTPRLCIALLFLPVMGSVTPVHAEDWSVPEQQLARKIVAVTGGGTFWLSFENRSSLGRRDSEIIQNGLRATLGSVGIQPAPSSEGVSAVNIVLSENAHSYVWVAQIQPIQAQLSVVMVSIPRAADVPNGDDSFPMALKKISLWQQNSPFLDVLVLEDGAVSSRIAVLEPERIAIYRLQNAKGQLEQSLSIIHAIAWPRDLRGRVVPGGDHLLDVYLPGVLCRSNATSPYSLSCHASDEPWPLVLNNPANSTRAGFASGQNFFGGAITPAIGKYNAVTPFYSAAVVIHGTFALWMFTGTDRHVHIVDAANDRITPMSWGSDIATLKSTCGAGWQVLATSPEEDKPDSMRAYEVPDRDPVPVSAVVDFAGTVSSLWTEPHGDTAVAVVRNQGTGGYEAFRLAMACIQ